MNKKILYSVIGVLALFLVYFMFFRGVSVTGNSIIEDSESVKIPLSSISKNAKFYDYQGIEYFVVKSNSGDVKVAFNACDVCYKAKKGYSQQGEDMVCNNCGNHYPISGLGTKNLIGGGCWPGYLPSTTEGDYFIIKKFDLELGRYRFQ